MSSLAHFLDEFETEDALYAPSAWRKRIDLLDALEWRLWHDSDAAPSEVDRASIAARKLEESNRVFFESIRHDILSGEGAHRLMQCVRESRNGVPVSGERYDHLDVLISGVLPLDEPDDPTTELAPDMVFYQPTPARQIFDFFDRVGLGKDDYLIDLGAGLGHVPLLAAISTHARSIGIELEPAYIASARQCADALKLERARFIQSDVRDADLSQGTVFYLYTPFMGELLSDVLGRLKREAQQRSLRIGTLGPCTALVGNEAWLQTDDVLSADRIALFRSAL